MINLAGKTYCDREIERELSRARIPMRTDEKSCGGEVDARNTGYLTLTAPSVGFAEFALYRAWYYWVVKGPTPLDVAWELYGDPVGRTDVRVAGHCGCPAPEKPWVDWFTATGKKILSVEQRLIAEEQEQNSSLIAGIFREENFWDEHLFSDEPGCLGRGYVMSYHIDSEVGLRLFVDVLRERRIVRPLMDARAVLQTEAR